MSRSSAPAYTVRQAAALLGLTEDAIRKRVLAGRLDGQVDGGIFVVSAEAVETERRQLLDRLNAVDARGGARPSDVDQEELERLREEVVRTRAALQSLTESQASLQDALKAQLDALQQFTLPGSPRALVERGSARGDVLVNKS
jgi:vacuolar-type H+-ATPase subunit I/STV1